MSQIKDIPGLILIPAKTFADNRGYFRETFRQEEVTRLLGNPIAFVQDNESLSMAKGTLRGLHFQKPPRAQAKLVRVSCGAIFDVAVDLRRNSPTFGQWRGFELSAENGLALFVPTGLAHGFCTLSPNTTVSYKVSDYYSPECDAGLCWNDPDLAISWPIPPTVVSEKDAALPPLAAVAQIFD